MLNATGACVCCLQFFRCDSTCLGFVKEKGASSFSLLGFSLAKARGRGDRGSAIALHSTRSYTWASRTSASPLAGQCLPCQDGTYILGGGGKECTPCPSGSGFCPGKNIVIPGPGHWQAQRCRSGRNSRHAKLTGAHTQEAVRALMNTSFDENVIPHFAAGMRRRPAASLRTRALRSTSATRRRPATAVCSVCLRRQPAQTSARRASPPRCFSTSSRTGPSLSPSSTM